MMEYKVTIKWSADDDAFIARMPELEDCYALGTTQRQALFNIRQRARLWLETAREFGDPIPEPKREKQNGKKDYYFRLLESIVTQQWNSQQDAPMTCICKTWTDTPYRRGMETLVRVGIIEGFFEGQLDTGRTIIRQMLEKRFGELPGTVEKVLGLIGDSTELALCHRLAVMALNFMDFEQDFAESGIGERSSIRDILAGKVAKPSEPLHLVDEKELQRHYRFVFADMCIPGKWQYLEYEELAKQDGVIGEYCTESVHKGYSIGFAVGQLDIARAMLWAQISVRLRFDWEGGSLGTVFEDLIDDIRSIYSVRDCTLLHHFAAEAESFQDFKEYFDTFLQRANPTKISSEMVV